MKRAALLIAGLAVSMNVALANELMAPGKFDVTPDGKLAPKAPVLVWKCDHPKLMLKMRQLAVGERITIMDAALKPTPAYAEGVEPRDGKPAVLVDNRILCQPTSAPAAI